MSLSNRIARAGAGNMAGHFVRNTEQELIYALSDHHRKKYPNDNALNQTCLGQYMARISCDNPAIAQASHYVPCVGS